LGERILFGARQAAFRVSAADWGLEVSGHDPALFGRLSQQLEQGESPDPVARVLAVLAESHLR